MDIVPDSLRDILGFLVNSYQSYGNMVRFKIGPFVFHLINHLDHIRHVLLEKPVNYTKHTRSTEYLKGYLWREFANQQWRVLEIATATGATGVPSQDAARLSTSNGRFHHGSERLENERSDDFMPFGARAPFCVGHEFAKMESMIIQSMLLKIERMGLAQ